MKKIKLYNGVKMPMLGLGTWQVKDGDETYNAVSEALRAGYRLIDTARAYGNEERVGKAIRDSDIPREEIFIVTKLPAEIKGFGDAWASFDRSCKLLGTDYIDLFLIHAPWPWDEMGKDCTEDNISSWMAFEDIYRTGKCKAIGVSNFEKQHIEPLLEKCEIVPMVNQIPYFIGFTQEETIKYCRKLDMTIMAYSPLAIGAIFNNEKIADIAKKNNVTVAQLAIAYCIQNNVVAIPKSVRRERIFENFKVDFIIPEEDMAVLDSIKDDCRP